MIRNILKGVWMFLRPDGSKRAKLERCSYLFVPQWGRRKGNERVERGAEAVFS